MKKYLLSILLAFSISGTMHMPVAQAQKTTLGSLRDNLCGVVSNSYSAAKSGVAALYNVASLPGNIMWSQSTLGVGSGLGLAAFGSYVYMNPEVAFNVIPQVVRSVAHSNPVGLVSGFVTSSQIYNSLGFNFPVGALKYLGKSIVMTPQYLKYFYAYLVGSYCLTIVRKFTGQVWGHKKKVIFLAAATIFALNYFDVVDVAQASSGLTEWLTSYMGNDAQAILGNILKFAEGLKLQFEDMLREQLNSSCDCTPAIQNCTTQISNLRTTVTDLGSQVAGNSTALETCKTSLESVESCISNLETCKSAVSSLNDTVTDLGAQVAEKTGLWNNCTNAFESFKSTCASNWTALNDTYTQCAEQLPSLQSMYNTCNETLGFRNRSLQGCHNQVQNVTSALDRCKADFLKECYQSWEG